MRHQDRLSPRVSADGSPDGSARLPAWVDAGVDLAIGRDQRLRPRLLSILVAAGVYFLSLLAQWNVVSLGLADRDAAIGLMAFIVIGVATVYVAVRCGLTRRFAEPALVTPQMVFALVSIACAYHINPHVRAVLPMLAALVIMFGAFSLKPRNCLRFGAFAVVVFGITMAASVWRRPDIFEPSIEAHHFLFTAAVLLTMA